MPDIGPLVSLVGSVGFSLLGLIIPCIMETVWYWYPKDDEDEEEDQERSHDFRVAVVAPVSGTSPAANGVDKTVSAVAAAVEETPETTNTGKSKETAGRRCQSIKKVIRHVKNFLLFLLGLCALFGGAFYNVRDIVALAFDS